MPDVGSGLSAEDQQLVHALDAPIPRPAVSGASQWWSPTNAMTMCAAILIFGLLVIALSSRLALKNLDKDTILKIVVIPMAVMSAIFLVVAGYTDSQIAPAIGLLGTIVGYVLGTAKVAVPAGKD